MGVALVVVAWAVVAGTEGNLNCDKDLDEVTSGKARWSVAVDGTVEVETSPEPLITFNAPGVEPLVVSVEAAGERRLLCGKVIPGKRYRVPLKKDDESPQTLLTIRLLGTPRDDDEKKRWNEQAEAARLANLLQTTLIEAGAVDNALGLEEIRKQLNAYKDVSKPPSKELTQAVTTAFEKTKERCGGPGLEIVGSPTQARCKRAKAVSAALGSLEVQFSRYKTAPKDESEKARRQSELEAAWLMMAPVYSFSPQDVQAYCTQTAPALLWFDNPGLTVLNVVHVPFGGPDTTVQRTVWKRGKFTIKGQKPESAVSFIISSVPHGTDITVEAKARTGQKKEVPEILSGVAALLLRTFPAAGFLEGLTFVPFPKSDNKPDNKSDNKPDDKPKKWDEVLSEACGKELKPKPPSNLVPLEPFSSRAYVLAEMSDTTMDILFCEGKTCPKDVSSVTRAEVIPTASASLALLAEFGLNAALTTADPGWAMGTPRFESTGGSMGPETLFELRYPVDARRLVTASLLIGSRFFDDKWFLGGGPTLLVGSGGGALTQWNLRAGWHFRKGLYFTFGGGVRFGPVATDYNPGDLIAVAGTAGTATAPTAFRTDQTAMLVLSAGLSFDLGVLGTAADSLLSSMGAKN